MQSLYPTGQNHSTDLSTVHKNHARKDNNFTAQSNHSKLDKTYSKSYLNFSASHIPRAKQQLTYYAIYQIFERQVFNKSLTPKCLKTTP